MISLWKASDSFDGVKPAWCCPSTPPLSGAAWECVSINVSVVLTALEVCVSGTGWFLLLGAGPLPCSHLS